MRFPEISIYIVRSSPMNDSWGVLYDLPDLSASINALDVFTLSLLSDIN